MSFLLHKVLHLQYRIKQNTRVLQITILQERFVIQELRNMVYLMDFILLFYYGLMKKDLNLKKNAWVSRNKPSLEIWQEKYPKLSESKS